MSDLQLPSSAAGWYDFAKMLSKRPSGTNAGGLAHPTINVDTPLQTNLEPRSMPVQSHPAPGSTVRSGWVPPASQGAAGKHPGQSDQIYESPGAANSLTRASNSGAAPSNASSRTAMAAGSPIISPRDTSGPDQGASTVFQRVVSTGIDIGLDLQGGYGDQYAAMQIDPKRIVIDSILVALVGSASEATKLNMLVFLQEECLHFFYDIKILWCFFNTMKHVIEQTSRRGTVTSVLKGQLLVVTTTILIEIEAIDEHRKVFNSFILLLSSIIQRTNSYSDCYCRQMACECLRELENTYPCLLSGFVEDILEEKDIFDPHTSLPSLFKLCHAERSHTSQSYTVLLLTILEHCTTRLHKERSKQETTFSQQDTSTDAVVKNDTPAGTSPLNVEPDSPALAQLPGTSGGAAVEKIETSNVTPYQTNKLATDSYTPTPSPMRPSETLRYSSAAQDGAEAKPSSSYATPEGSVGAPSSLSRSSHRKSVVSISTPLTARLSRIPVPLLRTGIADVLREMGVKVWPENRGKMPEFEVPNGTVGFGPEWVEYFAHFPQTMLAPCTNSSVSESDKLDQSAEANSTVYFSDFVVNKLVSVFSFVLKDAWELMSPWSLSCMVAKIVPFAHMLHLDPSIFRHHFLGLAFTQNTLLFHVALLLHSAISGVFSEQDELTLVRRLKVLMGDSSTIVQTRLLSVHWLLNFPAQNEPGPGYEGFSSLFLLLHQHSEDLWPSVFDPLILREAKLQALLHCFDTTPFSSCGPPPTMIDVLVCLGEYRYYGPFSRVSLAVYRFLYQLLRRFPNLCRDVQRVLHDTIVQCPRFVDNTIHLVDLYMHKHEKMKQDRNGKPLAFPPVATDKVSLFLLASFCPMLSSIEPARRLHHYFALLERIVSEPNLNPAPVLTSLLRYMRLTDVCFQGAWPTGAKILSICRSSLLTHPTALVYEALGDVLRLMSANYGDVDTRDRAWLYLQLLTHVERPKLMAVVNDSDASKKVIDFEPKRQRSVQTLPIKDFLTLDRSVDKRRAIGLDDGGTADIFHMLWDDPASCFTDGKYEDSSQGSGIAEDAQEPPISLLVEYFTFLLEQKDDFEIHMPLQIRYRPEQQKEDTQGNVRENNSDALGKKDPIYALLMEFSRSPDYVPIQSINLPYLRSVQNELLENNMHERFPYMYKLVLTLKPIVPVPTSFDVRLVFNDTEGGMYEGALQEVNVLFQDLFLPLPIKMAFSKSKFVTGSLDQDDSMAMRRITSQIFALLWDAVMLPDMGFGPTFSQIRNSFGGDGAESVKMLRMPRAAFMKALKSHLGPFVIPVRSGGGRTDYDDAEEEWYGSEIGVASSTVGSESDQNAKDGVSTKKGNNIGSVSDMKCFCAIVLLPPKYHLLFKFNVSDTSTMVRIRTDRWQLLSELDRWFETRWQSHP